MQDFYFYPNLITFYTNFLRGCGPAPMPPSSYATEWPCFSSHNLSDFSQLRSYSYIVGIWHVFLGLL